MSTLIFGFAYDTLARSTANKMDIPFIPLRYGQFADTEIWLNSPESSLVKNGDITIFFTLDTAQSCNDQLIYLFFLLGVIRRYGVARVTLVMPYLVYGRQDKKCVRGREALCLELLDLLYARGVTCVITFDMHSAPVSRLAPMPVISLDVAQVWAAEYKNHDNICVATPDQGGIQRAALVAKYLNASCIELSKYRKEPDKVETCDLNGDVDGKHVLMVDDIVSTGGTAIAATQELLSKGALSVSGLFTHAVFSPGSLQRLNESEIAHIFLTNTLYFDVATLPQKFSVIAMHNHIDELITVLGHHEYKKEK